MPSVAHGLNRFLLAALLAVLAGLPLNAGPFSPVVDGDEGFTPAADDFAPPPKPTHSQPPGNPDGRWNPDTLRSRTSYYAALSPAAELPDADHASLVGARPRRTHAVNYCPLFQVQIARYIQTGCVAGPSALYTAWSNANAGHDGRTSRRAAGNGPPLWDARDGQALARDWTGGPISTCYADLGTDRLTLFVDELNTPIDLFEPRHRPADDGDDDSPRSAALSADEQARRQTALAEDPKLLDPTLREAWNFLRRDADPSNETRPENVRTVGSGDGEGQPLGVVSRGLRWALHNPVETGVILCLSALLIAVIVRNPGQAQAAA